MTRASSGRRLPILTPHSRWEGDIPDEMRFMRGMMNFTIGDYAAALVDLSQIGEADAKYADAMFMTGNIHDARGEIAEALEAYGTVIEAGGADHLVYYNRGRMRYALGDYDDAIDDFNLAISMSPKFAEGFAERALSYLQLGSHRRAVDDAKDSHRLG